MTTLGLHGFARALGDRERAVESIEEYQAICQAKGIGLGLVGMGCKTFRQMTAPVTSYVVKSIQETLMASGVEASDVDHLVFSTTDKNLSHLQSDFATRVLTESGLTRALPVLVTMQQCVSSLGAMDHARRLFCDEAVRHVLLVSFDYVLEDAERIQPFALFGDAVTSCVMTRGTGWRLLSYGVGVDFAGLTGADDFTSRKKVVVSTMNRILEESGTKIGDVEKCFTTNLYKPIAWFNASVAGIHPSKLSIDTLPSLAHCGNCDWMLNVVEHQRLHHPPPGTRFLVQSFAPGFFAGAILGVTA
jgi:3-oxoacyl-[acyl-carrier-protein] synthase III